MIRMKSLTCLTVRDRSASRGPRSRGFTLVEMGIGVCILATLMTAVLLVRGFVDGARHQTALQLASVTRDASREWAKRFKASLDYNLMPCTEASDVPCDLTATGLPGLRFNQLKTSWGTAQLAPTAVGLGCNLAACVRIRLPIRDGEMCEDMLSTVREWSGVQMGAGQTRCLESPWRIQIVTH
jgi:hypothetical protein